MARGLQLVEMLIIDRYHGQKIQSQQRNLNKDADKTGHGAGSPKDRISAKTITDVNNYKEHFAAKHPKLVCDVAKFQAQLTAAGK